MFGVLEYNKLCAYLKWIPLNIHMRKHRLFCSLKILVDIQIIQIDIGDGFIFLRTSSPTAEKLT